MNQQKIAAQTLQRAAYRNRWADAYRELVTSGEIPDGTYEYVRIASGTSWDAGQRFGDDTIRDVVLVLCRSGSVGGGSVDAARNGLASRRDRSHIAIEGVRKMIRLGASLLAALFVLAGCSGGDRSAATTSASSAPVPTVTVTTSPPSRAGGLKTAVYAYSAAFLRGDGGTAYALLSERCRDRMTRSDFVLTAHLAKQLYGPQPIVTYREHVAEDLARVTYTYKDSQIDQIGEPWVFEGGKWRQDDCGGM